MENEVVQPYTGPFLDDLVKELKEAQQNLHTDLVMFHEDVALLAHWVDQLKWIKR